MGKPVKSEIYPTCSSFWFYQILNCVRWVY